MVRIDLFLLEKFQFVADWISTRYRLSNFFVARVFLFLFACCALSLLWVAWQVSASDDDAQSEVIHFALISLLGMYTLNVMINGNQNWRKKNPTAPVESSFFGTIWRLAFYVFSISRIYDLLAFLFEGVESSEQLHEGVFTFTTFGMLACSLCIGYFSICIPNQLSSEEA